MQLIDHPIVATGAAGRLAASANPNIPVGMLATLRARLVDASGAAAPPSGLGNVASWRFVLAEDWNPDTTPCYRTTDLTYDPATATWTIPLDGTRTAQALAALGRSGSIDIGCEIAGLATDGTWDKPTYVLQWTAKLLNRRDSALTPNPDTTQTDATRLVSPSGAKHVKVTNAGALVDQDGNAVGVDVDPTLAVAGAAADAKATGDALAAKAEAAALRYDLATPDQTPSGTTVAVTLQDRAVNSVTLASTVTAATFTFPEKVAGKARDFFLRLTIEGTTVPTIYFVEGSGNAVEPTDTNDLFDADDDSWAEIEPGVNLIMFTETQQPSS